jgi:Ca2+-transporting ATPase
MYHILIQGDIRLIVAEDIGRLKKKTAYGWGCAAGIGCSYRDIGQIPGIIDAGSVEKDLIFVGLLGMIDPARPEVVDAVKKCKQQAFGLL